MPSKFARSQRKMGLTISFPSLYMNLSLAGNCLLAKKEIRKMTACQTKKTSIINLIAFWLLFQNFFINIVRTEYQSSRITVKENSKTENCYSYLSNLASLCFLISLIKAFIPLIKPSYSSINSTLLTLLR